MAHIYGYGSENRLALRVFKDGKLKTRVFKNEEYPPFLSDCPTLDKQYVSKILAKCLGILRKFYTQN